jgi:beta-galactosidase
MYPAGGCGVPSSRRKGSLRIAAAVPGIVKRFRRKPAFAGVLPMPQDGDFQDSSPRGIVSLARIPISHGVRVRSPHIAPLPAVFSMTANLACTVCLLLCFGPAEPRTAALSPLEPRATIPLGGNWQYRRVASLGAAPPADGWQPTQVPGYLSGTDYQRAWFRRSFTVPASLRGHRLALRFGGVKFNSRVLVNGRRVGGCFGGYEPFEVDVTGAVRFDAPNELAVGCHDWTGVFTEGKVAFPPGAGGDALRMAPVDKILSPIGGLFASFGIWDDVTLEARPAVFLKDVFVKPSVRRGELAVEYVVANVSPRDMRVAVRASVDDAGREALSLGEVAVDVPAGKQAVATLRRPWPKPPLWSPDDPHLLRLVSQLDTGDRVRTRFGFREFWIAGDKYYLNGARINMLATSWWPPQGTMTREEIRKTFTGVKAMGCVAFRTHTQPWPAMHYEVADELGLLMIVEGAVWNDDDVYRIHDPRFWDAYAGHLRAMVDRDKNRPSVVMWSLENEFTGGRMNDASPAKKDLVRMGRMVRALDPTRPIFFESDGDPDGVADCIGIHYPHEYPQYTCWPNEGYWLREPGGGIEMFLNGQKQFFWKRDKPLYIGEFLWVPSSDPSWHTVFYGDEAYRDYARYRNLAKAESWKMQILAYRDQEVGGQSPWTVVEGGPLDAANPLREAHAYAYRRVAAYPLDYDSRFYAGERVVRRMVVFNDLLERSSLELRWKVVVGADAGASGRCELPLGPGERKHIEIVLPMPAVLERTSLDWQWAVARSGRVMSEDRRRFWAFPAPCAPQLGAKIGLFDPPGTTRRVLERLGVRVAAIDDLARVPPDIDVLVIGKGTLSREAADVPILGRPVARQRILSDFAARGGRILVLRQEAYPEGLFDVSLAKHRSTMTFAQDVRHPALAGIEGDDLKFWRGDHLVTGDEPARPAAGAVPIVVSGSAAGIEHVPLLERRAGRGTIVFSQMLLVEKCFSEPAAARILINTLAWLASRTPTASRKTAVVGGGPEYANLLASWGLRFDATDALPPPSELPQYGLIICRGEPQDLERLRGAVEAGARVWLHRLAPERIAEVARKLGTALDVQPYAGPVSRSEADDPLTRSIAREDLYWLGKNVGVFWNETPRASRMADAVFSKHLDEKSALRYPMDGWKLEGEIVRRNGDAVVFATAGVARRAIEFPRTGTYLIGVRAYGTPCGGIYPAVRVAVDGAAVGMLGTGPKPQTTTVSTRVAKGPREVSIAFINDGSDPPREDRNLFVEQVFVTLDDADIGPVLLTSPAALAVARIGKGMVVFDQIAWDTEEVNARKATRFAGSLLTALGGDVAARDGVTLEAERMTPQPGMPHFANAGGFASLACSGYIASRVKVETPGRYLVELVAAGTPAAGVYPEVQLELDGRPLGKVQLTAGTWRSYRMTVELPAGEHRLHLAFTNDYSGGGEDRNLQVDKLIFYRP